MEAKERGNKAFQAGDWQAAAQWYTSALESDPGLVAAWANRAACAIHMQMWDQGLADCDAALALQTTPALRVKVLWRRAVCLRNQARDETAWRDTVQQGLSLDPSNDKLQEERYRLFIRRTEAMPSAYTRGATRAAAPIADQHNSAAGAAGAHRPGQATLFAPPPRPLTYSGVLKLVRSKSEMAYAYWYSSVDPAELVEVHKSGGIEPDTLDYIHEMISTHPDQREKNKEFMRALPQCARYTSASLLADAALHNSASAVTGVE